MSNRGLISLPLFALAVVVGLLVSAPALAAPEAHLLRVDPRSAVEDDAPILTTVIELLQQKSLSDLTSQCAHVQGEAAIACLSDKLDNSRALYEPFKFPEENANLLVTVDDRDLPAKLVSVSKWRDSKKDKGVGTAWLLLIDASGQMGSRFEEAKRVAKAFVDQMGPNDIVDVMFFNDRAIVEHSKWTPKKGIATNFIDGVKSTFPKQGRVKTIMSIVQKGVTDAFGELGNVGKDFAVPLHQAMVLLTDCNAGTDINSTATGALQLRDYLTKGRFPEDNTTLPKMPMPVISVWFPNKQGTQEEVFENARQFMENLANPEIGGGFYIVGGPDSGKGGRIAKAVTERFDLMNIVKWRVPCLAPTVTQNFQLVFKEFEQPIKGDVCTECPLGQDPKLWPLAINYEETEKAAKANKLYPGGTVKVFGDFCWGTDIGRAELYMLPKNQPAPQSLEGKSLEEAQQARDTLIRANLRGKAINGGDEFIEFELPETTKFLAGDKKSMTARLVIFDSRAGRTSPVTADKVLTLAAQEEPLDYFLIGGITFGGVVVLLLLISVFRGGGRSRRRAHAAPPPAPVVAGAGAPRPGPAPVPNVGYAPPPAPAAPPAPAPYAPPAYPGGPGVAGGTAPVAFPDAAHGHGHGHAHAHAPAPMAATHATLQGTVGVYPVNEGVELKVGRDPGLCDICLTEPRISGMHATVKFEAGQLYVRDEGSNNGTYIDNGKVQSYAWMSVPAGGSLRFGPIEFTVRLG
jgi:hypothetical protein